MVKCFTNWSKVETGIFHRQLTINNSTFQPFLPSHLLSSVFCLFPTPPITTHQSPLTHCPLTHCLLSFPFPSITTLSLTTHHSPTAYFHQHSIILTHRHLFFCVPGLHRGEYTPLHHYNGDFYWMMFHIPLFQLLNI
jgi:hypothetical protein